KQPSVSAQKLGIEDCAKIVKKQMDIAGLKAKILPVKNGNPVVYGEARSKSSSKTLLIYGHYDVQPVEPLEKWVSGPFDAKLSCAVRRRRRISIHPTRLSPRIRPGGLSGR